MAKKALSMVVVEEIKRRLSLGHKERKISRPYAAREIRFEGSDDYKIIPGHGSLNSKSQLEEYRQMILDSIATVRKGIKSGHTLEQIQKAGLPSKWEPYSHGYVSTNRWIALVYAGLVKQSQGEIKRFQLKTTGCSF